jgi:hypothetical protein
MDPEAREAANESHAVAYRECHGPESALGISVEEAGHDEQRRADHLARCEPEEALTRYPDF